jgi:two-component system OmpR family response regulator
MYLFFQKVMKVDKILLVEDDAKITEIVRKYLTHSGYQLTCAPSGELARSYVENESFAIILLDVMLPDTNGFEWLHELRNGTYQLSSHSAHIDTPVIMLTALGQTKNVIKGLKTGADDYITKPFDPAELVERVAVILRRIRKASPQQEIKQIGALTIHLALREVMCGEKMLVLHRREYDLLIFLSHHAQQVFTRDELLTKVWGIDFDGSDRAVDISIQRLRSNLQSNPTQLQIKTVRGIGYKLEVIPS